MSTGFLCLDKHLDVNIFFPLRERGSPVDHAKTYCFKCLRRKDCLAIALKTGEEHGIFGGMTYSERRQFILREALMEGKFYSQPQNTLHVQQHPLYVSPSFLVHTLDVHSRIQQVLSRAAEESLSYQVTLPTFL